MRVTSPDDGSSLTLENSPGDTARLAWRIPIEDRSGSFRAGLAPTLVFGVIFAAFFFLIAPQQARLLGFMVMLPLISVVLYLYWKSMRRRLNADANVWIDAGGVHWLDDHGREHGFDRKNIHGFHIGLDSDTLHLCPALTLLLPDGFESQPIELHEPASPSTVRNLLANEMRVPQRPLVGQVFADRLRKSLHSALASWPPSPEKRLLKRSLVEMIQQDDGAWLFGDIPELGRVFFDSVDCSFRVVNRGGQVVELSSLSDFIDWGGDQLGEADAALTRALADQIRWKPTSRQRHGSIARLEELAQFLGRQLGPDVGRSLTEIDLQLESLGNGVVAVTGTLGHEGEHWNINAEIGDFRGDRQLGGFVEVISQRELEEERLQRVADVRDAGFYCHCDDHRRVWSFTGPKRSLLELCDKIDRTAETFKKAPLGARPKMTRVGGDAMSVTIQPAQHAWIGESTFCGPPQRLRQLAGEMRQSLAEANIGDETSLRVSLDDREKWTVQFHLTGEDFDPADDLHQCC